MSLRGAFGRRMGGCRPDSTGGLCDVRGMGNVATAGDENADDCDDTEPGVGGCEEQMDTAHGVNARHTDKERTLTAVIPITGPTGGVARDRVAAGDAQLAGLVLDGKQHTRHGRGFGRLGGGAGGLAGFSARAELVKAQGTGPEMGALVETALVADDFARIEGGPPPGGGLGGVAVEAAPAEILGLLARGVVCELHGDGGGGGSGEKGGVALEGVAELGGDDEGGVLELDRLWVGAVGDGGVVDGEVVIVLGLGEVVADVGVGGAAGDGVGVELLLLLVVPFGVVGGVVNVKGVVVVVLVELVEECVGVVGVEPGLVGVEEEVRVLEDVGERSDRDGVLWVDVMEVGGTGRGRAGSGRSVGEGRRGGIRVELHPG